MFLGFPFVAVEPEIINMPKRLHSGCEVPVDRAGDQIADDRFRAPRQAKGSRELLKVGGVKLLPGCWLAQR
jgi:hypothetical protein